MPISDDQSAREAFTHVVVTVNRIDQLSARTQAQAIMGAATPVDDILEKLREWFDRLLSALTRIAAKLAGGHGILGHGRQCGIYHRRLRSRVAAPVFMWLFMVAVRRAALYAV